MTIFWMMDETLAHADPKDWNQIRTLYDELILKMGKPELCHSLVDPVVCLKNLVLQIKKSPYTTVFDLTGGWLAPILSHVFPDAQVISDFSMTRVRQVSSAKLTTVGYTVSPSILEIQARSRVLRKGKILTVDDVSFSGYTGESTDRLWGIDETDHAFLILNTASLRGDRRVFAGMTMNTDAGDDGWHLKDLHQHPQLERAFEVACELIEAFASEGKESIRARQILDSKDMIAILFPGSFSQAEIAKLHHNGRFEFFNNQANRLPHGKKVANG